MGHLDLDFQEKQGPGAWEHSQSEGKQWKDGQEDLELNGVQDCPGFNSFVHFCHAAAWACCRVFGGVSALQFYIVS
jgi:hypothetical protein